MWYADHAAQHTGGRTTCHSAGLYAIMSSMGDLLPLLVLAIVGVTAGALFDCVTTDDRAIRQFPRSAWIAVILLLPGLGGVLWFTSGRATGGPVPEHIASGHPAGRGRIEQPTLPPPTEMSAPRTLAPDDDPEFLARLSELNRKARRAEFEAGFAGSGGRGGETHRPSDEERLRRWEADLRQREERLRQRGEPPAED
jgi:hypothetical protein